MIAYISGKVVGCFSQSIIVKVVSGIGYLIGINPQDAYLVNENVEMFIYHVQREDKVELYGFKNLKDREWVDKLLKVSGVGPKMAATIIYQLGADGLQSTLATADATPLTNVKGLGSKTAKKILIELKDTHVNLEDVERSIGKSQTITDFTETLANLGFKRGEIVSVITQLKKDKIWSEDNLMDMVKHGLKYLNKTK